MSSVTVNIYRLVDGAALGAVRLDVDGQATILLHDGLPIDEQSSLVDELLRPGEMAVYVNDAIPAPRSAVADVAVGLG